MKLECSEARELMLTHRLSKDQLESLRVHARECSGCAAEVEGMLVTMRLEEGPLERPSSTFADTVMTRVETMPAPRASIIEHYVAAVACAATICGLAVTLPTIKKIFLDNLSVQVSTDVNVGMIKGAAIHLARVIDSLVAGGSEIVETIIVSMGVTIGISLVAAGVVGCGLAAVLYAPRLKNVLA